MERLWSPWRAAYVADDNRPPGCFLCQKPAEQRDDENLILYRGGLAYVVMNIYPYNSGHLLVAPYQHISDLGTAEPALAAELMALVQRCLRAISAAYRPEGFNAGMNLGSAAGAGEPGHLHMHVVPRWEGDTNFMPVLAATKTLPETLQQTYAKLKPQFASV